MKKGVVIAIVVIAGLCAAAVFGYKKIQRDRLATLAYTPPAPRLPGIPSNGITHQTVTYTAKDLEEMRKQGKVLPGADQRPMTVPLGNSADDATQRALKTLNDINRINETNRRLMEQQERMQRQK